MRKGFLGLLLGAGLMMTGHAAVIPAKDLGFRYTGGKCVDSSGKEGRNSGYIGQCSDVSGVQLGGFNFSGIDLSGSTFEASDIQNGNFKTANLTGVVFTGANLSGAEFAGAVMHGTVLTKALMVKAHLEGADLKGAIASATKFRRATLRGAQLNAGLFAMSDFVGADLEGANLDGADFSKTDLRGCSLKNISVQGTVFTGGRYSKLTTLPFSEGKAKELGMIFAKGGVVLIINDRVDDPDMPKLLAYLQAAGAEAKVSAQLSAQFDASKDNLEDFTAVFHITGTTNEDVPVAGQEALVDFVTKGGTYIGTAWAPFWINLLGHMKKMRDLVILTYTDGATGVVKYILVTDKADHPILEGLSTGFEIKSDICFGPVATFSTGPVTALAMDAKKHPLIAVRDFGAGHVVNFAFGPNVYSNALADPSAQKLILNSINWFY